LKINYVEKLFIRTVITLNVKSKPKIKELSFKKIKNVKAVWKLRKKITTKWSRSVYVNESLFITYNIFLSTLLVLSFVFLFGTCLLHGLPFHAGTSILLFIRKFNQRKIKLLINKLTWKMLKISPPLIIKGLKAKRVENNTIFANWCTLTVSALFDVVLDVYIFFLVLMLQLSVKQYYIHMLLN